MPGFGILMALLLKGTKLLKVVKVLKALKAVKAAGTALSMGLSVFVYSFLMGPWFAVGFVLLLFAHEMGHVIALRMRGYPASAPIFIPMLGAVIFAPEFRNRDDEAYIGFGGPLLGGLTSALCLLWWHITQSELILRLAYTSAFINLFNLLPIRPLDGGRVLQVVGSWTKYIAIAILGALSWLVREPSMMLIWILILDDIGLRPRLRAHTAWSLWSMMTLMMVTGHSSQPGWNDALDIGVGILLCILYEARARSAADDAPEPVQPNLAMPLRLAWVAAYAALAAGLMTLMAGGTPATHRPAVAFALGVAVFMTAARAAVPFYLWQSHNPHSAFSKPPVHPGPGLAYSALCTALCAHLRT